MVGTLRRRPPAATFRARQHRDRPAGAEQQEADRGDVRWEARGAVRPPRIASPHRGDDDSRGLNAHGSSVSGHAASRAHLVARGGGEDAVGEGGGAALGERAVEQGERLKRDR